MYLHVFNLFVILLTLFKKNSKSVRSDPHFSPESNLNKQIPAEKIRSMLAVPVFDVHGNVIAVIQALNKVDAGGAKKIRKRASINEGNSLFLFPFIKRTTRT